MSLFWVKNSVNFKRIWDLDSSTGYLLMGISIYGFLKSGMMLGIYSIVIAGFLQRFATNDTLNTTYIIGVFTILFFISLILFLVFNSKYNITG